MGLTPEWALPLEQDQRTSAWRKWRHKGLGASDIPVIMGVSPWKTPYQLWEEKIQDEPPENKTSYILEKGKETEVIARNWYSKIYKRPMSATTKVHPEYDFLRASLDGYDADMGLVLEIKLVGKEDHDLAKQGKIPNKYIPQLQAQLLVTGAKSVHYFSFCEGHGEIVVILPDPEYQQKILKAARAFWSSVLTKTPPELTDKDYVEVENEELLEKIKKWSERKKSFDKAEAELEDAKEEVERLLTHSRMKGAGVRIQKIVRKGSIQYKNIEELKNIDLEKYRGKSTEYFSFGLEKE